MIDESNIIKSANIYLAAKDKNLKYIYCNENVAMGLGLDSPRGIVGKKDYALFNGDIAKMYQTGDICVFKGRTLLNAREIQPHTNKTIQILTTKNPLKNNQDDLKGVVISFIDITDMNYLFTQDKIKCHTSKNRFSFTIGNVNQYFTKRECVVFKFILLDLTGKQIANNLCVSHRTVETYINQIKNKLQCGSKYHIAEAAMRLGLIHQNIIAYIK